MALFPAEALRLGGQSLPGRIFLAPVAGYSDAAYRSVCHELGADLCYTEMVSSEALTRGHPGTRILLEREDCESEYAIQLFGGRPQTMAEAVRMLLPWKPSVIDLNCGCPVPKVVKTLAGSSLLRMPESIREIVTAMVEAAEDIPVTVKIRSGWDAETINFLETAQAAVDGGARAVTLHARTRAQGYSGRADWSHIGQLVRALPVPVFGSGDVFSATDAASMIERTGCAGVMVARGAIGNPFIFAQIKALAEGEGEPRFPVAERARVAMLHLQRSVRYLGERKACIEFRKQFCAYTRGMPGGAPLREKAVRSLSVADYEAICGEWIAAPGAAEAMDRVSVPEADALPEEFIN